MPKFKKILLLTSIILTFLLLPLFRSQKVTAQTILFQDNFDDGNANGWAVIGSPGWNVFGNKYGILLNPGLSNSIPSDSLWNYSWTNISYELDLHGNQGVDKNILLKFKDTSNFIELHANDHGIVLEKASSIGGAGILASSNMLLANNTDYHFKFEIEDNKNIKVYLNNILMFDVAETAPLITNWKIGLRAGTGGTPICDVWFDNVVVTSLDTAPTQIVFLPGLGGSVNFKEMFLGIPDPAGWRMTPGANVYDNLLKAFEGNPNFHTFYYDWRRPVLENAAKLNTYIESIMTDPNQGIYLLGHSMGGLVARACVQTTPQNCHANRLVTVGSPHFGAVNAYPAVEAGEVWSSGLTKLWFEILLRYFQNPGETNKNTVHRVFPGLNDLLPTFDYLTKNGAPLSPNSLTYKNTLLVNPLMQTLTPLENKTNTIFGWGVFSVNTITLGNPDWLDTVLGNWPDGKPTSKSSFTNGDGTVLGTSAVFLGNSKIPNFVYYLDHSGIISAQSPLSQIFQLLGQTLPAGTYNPLKETERYLVFMAHSPIKITTPDASSNYQIGDELIIIPDPENKNYHLSVQGTGNGFYGLSVGQIGTQSANWNDYYGNAQNGVTQNLEFNINIENPPSNPLNNNQGFNSTEFDTLMNECKNLTNSQSALQKYKNMILTYLNKILSLKSNPESALNYVNMLRSTIATLEQMKVIDPSFAGQLREYLTEITSYLEGKAFESPKTTLKQTAQNYLNSAKTTINEIETKKNISKAGALVFSEAKEKANQAQNYFDQNQYYQTKILSMDTIGLLLEVKILSR